MLDWIIDLVNYLIVGIGIAISWIIQIFPDSPFAQPAAPPKSINLGYVTWLLPFPTMIVHALALTTVILIYYGIRVAARWIKIVKN